MTMADMTWLAAVCIATGFLIVVLALSGARHDLSGSSGAVEALEIVGFLSYLFCFVLTALIVFVLSESEFKEEVTYAMIVLSFLAVFFLLIGIILYGCRVSRKPPPYTTTLLVSSAILAALGGIFALLQVLEVEM